MELIGIGAELLTWTPMDDLTSVEHDGFPRQLQGEAGVLLDDNDRETVVVDEIGDHVHQLLDDDRCEALHRFVEQQKPGGWS